MRKLIPSIRHKRPAATDLGRSSAPRCWTRTNRLPSTASIRRLDAECCTPMGYHGVIRYQRRYQTPWKIITFPFHNLWCFVFLSGVWLGVFVGVFNGWNIHPLFDSFSDLDLWWAKGISHRCHWYNYGSMVYGRYIYITIWLVVDLPLWKMMEFVNWEGWHLIYYGSKIHVPNHQPDLSLSENIGYSPFSDTLDNRKGNYLWKMPNPLQCSMEFMNVSIYTWISPL